MDDLKVYQESAGTIELDLGSDDDASVSVDGDDNDDYRDLCRSSSKTFMTNFVIEFCQSGNPALNQNIFI
jgi:hypothetical protein